MDDEQLIEKISCIKTVMFVSCDNKEKKWKDYTVVVPCISVGNVGQLTADLIISTLSMDKVGHFHDDSIISLIGNDPFSSGTGGDGSRMMTAAQVFEKEEHKLVVVQLRSGIVKGRKQQFVSKLQEWISTCGFHQVVILTSCHSHERLDSQLGGTQLRFVPTSHFQETEAAKFIENTLKWVPLEKRDAHPAFRDADPARAEMLADRSHGNEPDREAAEAECQGLFLPGGGLAKQLLQKCIEHRIPTVAILRFCAEGDNMPEALDLATYLNTWTGWVDTKNSSSETTADPFHGWKIPLSWRLLFGSGFQQVLFH